jgi:hypothetical protein
MSGKRISILLGWKLVVISRVCRTCYVIPFVPAIRMTMTNAPCKDRTHYDCEGSTCKHCFTIEPLTLARLLKSLPNTLNHSTQIPPPTPLIMFNTGSNIGNNIKGAVKGIHGAGKAIRGTFNQAVDTAFSDKAGEAKNKAVAEKSINEVEAADRNVGARHSVKRAE